LKELAEAAEIVARGQYVVALTGAGISVDSGIPDFRSPGGLWDRFDPMEYAHIEAFYANPRKVWNMLREMSGTVRNAKPNSGHLALAELERLGLLKAIITQNIDNMHQDAGSTNVIEFHGNVRQLVCMRCNARYNAREVETLTEKEGVFPPVCPHDGQILKPNVVFFGEAIPIEASYQSQYQAEACDVMLVIGTSATVFPASGIPMIARRTGATVIEFNITSTPLTGAVAQLSILGSSSVTLPEMVKLIAETSG